MGSIEFLVQMRKYFLIVAMCLVAWTMNVYAEEEKAAEERTAEEKVVEEKAERVVPEGYVDLGLPSKTLWKEVNEDCGLLTYKEAVDMYRRSLPTRKQMLELKYKCRWEKADGGFKLTGPNGNSIILPLDGYINCSGQFAAKGKAGSYWSRTDENKNEAWRMSFEDGKAPYKSKVSVASHLRCYGRSIRLVTK